MQQVDRLQAAHHHLEAHDAIRGVPVDQIDALDRDAVDHGLELEHRRALGVPLVHVAEAVRCRARGARRADSARERASHLRREHDRRFERHVVREQIVEPVRVMTGDQPMPAFDQGGLHSLLLPVFSSAGCPSDPGPRTRRARVKRCRSPARSRSGRAARTPARPLAEDESDDGEPSHVDEPQPAGAASGSACRGGAAHWPRAPGSPARRRRAAPLRPRRRARRPITTAAPPDAPPAAARAPRS